MTDASIIVDELTITPLKRDYKLVHPAIGISEHNEPSVGSECYTDPSFSASSVVVNSSAYVGVWFPCMVSIGKKSTVKDLLFLITSDRQKILANDTVLRTHGWRLEYKPTRFKNRWALDDVEAYLNGADVDPASVFDSVCKAWKTYLEFTDERDYAYHALWDIGTYFYFLFSAYPYADHGGSTETGKSKALTLSSLLAFNAILSNNMSTASIYRLIQNARATLLLDETEKLSTRSFNPRVQEFRSILLSGYKRGGQAVYRVEKDKDTEVQNTVPFEVYSPKRIANIEGLEDVVANRCKITIHRRSINDAIIKLDPDLESVEWVKLRGQLYILFLQFWKEIRTAYATLNPEESEGLDGRQFELWKPILALAQFFDAHNGKNPSDTHDKTINVQVSNETRKDAKGGSVLPSLSSQGSLSSSMKALALDTAKQSKVENLTEASESILLQVLQELVHGDAYVSVKDVREKMSSQFDEEPKWLTTKWIGNTLRRLGFKDKRRVGTGYQYKLNLEDVKDVAERMGATTPLAEKKDPLPEPDESLKQTLETARQWISEHKDADGSIDICSLVDFLKESRETEPSKIIDVLKADGILFTVPKLGKLGTR